MLVLESKLKGKNWQSELLEEAIRTANFVRNKALRYWMDNKEVSKNDFQKLCATLAKEYEWAGKLNSQARQASADRAWNGISRYAIVYEDLKVSNLVKNHKKAKSISDAAWSMFANWVEYFGKLRGVRVVAVSPHFTSQDCSKRGTRVEKSLSTRTQKCLSCGLIEHRDLNAARNILVKGLGIKNTAGQACISTLREIAPLACTLVISIG